MLSSLAELWHMLRYNHICNYSEGSDAIRAACWCLNKLAWNIKNTCTASGTEIMCLLFHQRNQILCRDIGKTYFTWGGGGALVGELGRLVLHKMGPETGPEGRARLISICSNKCGRAAAHLLSAWKIKWDLQSSGLLRLMCSNYQPGPARYPLSCQQIDETDRRLPVLILSSVLFRLERKTDDINKSAFGKSGSSAVNLTHSQPVVIKQEQIL